MANWKPFYKYNTCRYTKHMNTLQWNADSLHNDTNRKQRKKGQQEMTTEDIRRKRSNITKNYEMAKAFVRSKEAEIADLKDRLIHASSTLDPDSYISIMKQISEKETELTVLKEIAEQNRKACQALES